MIMTTGLSPLFGRGSEGRSTITYGLIQKAMSDGKAIVFLDSEASFNPDALLAYGLELREKRLADPKFMIGTERLERRREPR